MEFPGKFESTILVGIISVGRLGVALAALRP